MPLGRFRAKYRSKKPQIATQSLSSIRTGIAGWIDKSLIESGKFYPPGCTSSEERLTFYGTQFRLVEVDSTYYGMPVRRNSDLWVERTPADFKFDVKSFSLFTNHPTKAGALPKEIREGLPEKMRHPTTSFYLEKAPPAVVDESWEWFRDALEPLRAAGKLGAVFFQFPPWFYPSSRALGYIEEVQERMFGFLVAIEFRHRDWLDERHLEGTLDFLKSRGLPYVAVDTPQGFTSALPPVAKATSPELAIIRFHGRNRETWNQKGAPPNVRFRHFYTDAELGEWVPKIQRLAGEAREVHAVMNNNYSNYSVENARRLQELLAEAGTTPD